MTSCSGLFACVRHLLRSDESYAISAEKNADKLSAVYGSHIVEAQHALDETLRKSVAALKALRVAKEEGNAVAVARAQVGARACATRVRELRARIDTNSRLQQSCERAVTGLREARQYQSTVGALAAVQRQFKSLRMGTLMDEAEGTMAEMGAATEELGDIRTMLGAPMVGSADSQIDAEEELAALLAERTESLPPILAPPPAAVSFTSATPKYGSKLPTVEAYAAALHA